MQIKNYMLSLVRQPSNEWTSYANFIVLGPPTPGGIHIRHYVQALPRPPFELRTPMTLGDPYPGVFVYVGQGPLDMSTDAVLGAVNAAMPGHKMTKQMLSQQIMRCPVYTPDLLSRYSNEQKKGRPDPSSYWRTGGSGDSHRYVYVIRYGSEMAIANGIVPGQELPPAVLTTYDF